LKNSCYKKSSKEAVKEINNSFKTSRLLKTYRVSNSRKISEQGTTEQEQEEYDEYKENKRKDQEQLEAILEKAANEASSYSVQLDER